jgi:hypothetical protein
MSKGDSAWYMDQVFVSMLIDDYTRRTNQIYIDTRTKQSLRLDVTQPYHMWERQYIAQFSDAHVVHDEIFDTYRWSSFKHLLDFLFDSSLANQFNVYYKQFVLTLRDPPDNF